MTPAPLISDANVCRASCRPIGSSSAFTHASLARRRIVESWNGWFAVRPKASPVVLSAFTATSPRCRGRGQVLNVGLAVLPFGKRRSIRD
jgi:hypothetical protein